MMKILSWNINSVRKRINQLSLLINRLSPDVICLQETKVENASFPHLDFQNLGFFYQYLNGIKAYNGVCILSKYKSERSHLINFCGKKDGRHLSETILGIDINNLYVPAGGDEPDLKKNEKFIHKIKFLNELISWSKIKLKKSIVLGDFNIAPRFDDVWSHKQLINTVSHTEIERIKIKEFYERGRWVDIVRNKLNPPQNIFTWWSYRSPDFRKYNRGRRLDHFWVTSDLVQSVSDVRILDYTREWEKPSDHVPILVEIQS